MIRRQAAEARRPLTVRFRDDSGALLFEVSTPLRGFERAERVALRGIDARWGRFPDALAEVVDIESDEVLVTISAVAA